MTFRARRVLVCFTLAATAATGCISSSRSNDASDTAHHEADRHPQTCAELQQQMDQAGNSLQDGQYRLFVEGDPAKPWRAYCAGMRWDNPHEYLEVQPANNYSQLAYGERVVTTSFPRYRIDPETLSIDPMDAMFAKTKGNTPADKLPGGSFVPAGWAELDAETRGADPPATASVDLSGTGFAFHDKVKDDDPLTFFCSLTGDSVDVPRGDEVRVSADLGSFQLKAANPEPGPRRVVADCHNMTAATLQHGAWPLRYRGSTAD